MCSSDLLPLPAMACVVVTPEVGVSTPKAFAEWDRRLAESTLTSSNTSDRMNELGRGLSAWLSDGFSGQLYSGAPLKGVKPGSAKRGRAENPLLALVRAGIENDFEQVVFPEYPVLGEGKRALLCACAKYASLSGDRKSVV